MADSDVIRKLHTYRALFRQNRGFALLSRNLDWLTVHRVLANHAVSDAPEWWACQLEEIQAAMNRPLTETLHNLEHGDVRRLGRILEMAPEPRAKYYPPDEPEQEQENEEAEQKRPARERAKKPARKQARP